MLFFTLACKALKLNVTITHKEAIKSLEQNRAWPEQKRKEDTAHISCLEIFFWMNSLTCQEMIMYLSQFVDLNVLWCQMILFSACCICGLIGGILNFQFVRALSKRPDSMHSIHLAAMTLACLGKQNTAQYETIQHITLASIHPHALLSKPTLAVLLTERHSYCGVQGEREKWGGPMERGQPLFTSEFIHKWIMGLVCHATKICVRVKINIPSTL